MSAISKAIEALRRIANRRLALYGNDDFFALQKIARAALDQRCV